MADITIQFNNGRRSGKANASTGCVVVFFVLFGLPFAGFGVAALIKGVRNLTEGRWVDGVGLTAFGLFFSAVGFGLWVVAYLGVKAKKRVDAIKTAHPQEPWLWNEKWADGRIASSGKASMVLACVVAVFWNSISWTVIILALPKEIQKGHSQAWFTLLFPVVGMVLAGWAIREILRWKKFGQSTFKMLAVPGVIGGQLSGAIQTSVKIRPEDGFHIRLRCVNRISSGSGDSSSTTETIVWENEKTMVKELLSDDPRHSGFPVFFQIPADCPESDHTNPHNQMVWRLDARAAVPGLDYSAQFEVPVFRVADAAVATPASDPTVTYQKPAEPYQVPARSRIRVRETATGGKEFIFPAMLNPGVAVVVAAVLAVFSGATWVMLSGGKAPIIFPVMFSFADLVILLVLINLLFKSSRITVETGGMTIVTRWLLFRRVRSLSPGQVADIMTKIGMTSGQNVYYDIQVWFRPNGKITAASAIKDRKEAEWMVAEMKRVLKLDKPAPPFNISP